MARRPKTRGDCAAGPRPCLWAGCRYHLLLDVTPAGTIFLADGHDDPSRLKATCALDVAESGPQTLEAIAATIGTTRERVRQIETSIVETLRHTRVGRPLERYVDAFDDVHDVGAFDLD